MQFYFYKQIDISGIFEILLNSKKISEKNLFQSMRSNHCGDSEHTVIANSKWMKL